PEGFDGRPRGAGRDVFVLVWKWDRQTRQRSAGWVREDAVCRPPADPRAGRPFEAELAGGRTPPVFFQHGAPPTASRERFDQAAAGARVPTKVVLKRTRPAAKAEDFRVLCYTAPGGAAIPDLLRVLQHYYAYAAARGDERWYLIGGEDFLSVRR